MASDQVLDLERIETDLFQDARVRERLQQEYELESEPGSPRELSEALVRAMGQEIPRASLADARDGDIFRAAVEAISSGSRRWSTYLAMRAQLQVSFGQFNDPAAWTDRLQTPNGVAELASVLGGQSPTQQADAIAAWAERASGPKSVGDVIRAADQAMRAWSEAHDTALSDTEATLALAARLAHSNSRWPAGAHAATSSLSGSDLKGPGMGVPIAMEFLRNLGCPGFKPDTHVVRLLMAWTPELVHQQEARARALAQLAGTRNKDIIELIQVALAGCELTPKPSTGEVLPRYNRADNLLWLLGSKLVPIGKELNVEPYLRSGR